MWAERSRPKEENPGTATTHSIRESSISGPSLFSAQAQVRRALAGLDLGAHRDDLVADAIGSALPAQWEARARVFEDCRPRPGDYLGTDPTAAQRIDRRCAVSAAQCRLHAAVLRGDDILDPEHAADLALIGAIV